MGSVAQYVILKATCPVLTVKNTWYLYKINYNNIREHNIIMPFNYMSYKP
jgi:hypothetical protein